MAVDEHFRRTLRDLIAARGSQAQFCEKAGLREATLSALLTKSTDVQLATLEKIASGLGWNVEGLLREIRLRR